MELTQDSVVARSPHLMEAEVGRELVLMSVERGTYFALDAVGAAVWRRLEAPLTVRGLCAALATEYDVTDETCAADVLGFLAELDAAGLLVVAADGA